MFNFFSVTGDNKYTESAIKIGEWAKKFQQHDGSFVTHRKEGFVHMHPHSYTTEGMLALGLLCNRKDFIKSAVQGMKFSIGMQLESGGISCFYRSHNKSPYERVDALAQTIRLFILGTQHGLKMDKKKIDAAVARLKLFHRYDSEKKEVKGCFVYGYTEEGKKLEHAPGEEAESLFKIPELKPKPPKIDDKK